MVDLGFCVGPWCACMRTSGLSLERACERCWRARTRTRLHAIMNSRSGTGPLFSCGFGAQCLVLLCILGSSAHPQIPTLSPSPQVCFADARDRAEGMYIIAKGRIELSLPVKQGGTVLRILKRGCAGRMGVFVVSSNEGLENSKRKVETGPLRTG
jgi:hypothetical protein